MGRGATVTVVTGEPGAGKSFLRGSIFPVQEFLPQRPAACHLFTNLPIFPVKVAEYAAKRKKNDQAEEYEARLHVIDVATLKEWEEGRSGPWEYFAEAPAEWFLHLQLDEAYLYCGENKPAAQKKQWAEFLGTARHGGLEVELLCQDRKDICKEVGMKIGLEIRISKGEEQCDRFFGIPCGDWLELMAKWTGEWRGISWMERLAKLGGRLKVQSERGFIQWGEYFQLYDSHNASESKFGVRQGAERPREYAWRSWPSLIAWFFSRNWFQFSTRFVPACLIIWLGLFGGWAHCMTWGRGWLTSRMGHKLGAATAADVGPRYAEPGSTPAAAADVATKQATLEKQVKELAEKLGQAAEVNRQLAEQMQRCYSLVGIGVGECSFRNGNTYRIGDLIDYGPYAGRRVASVQRERACVMLDDGLVLRMARREVQPGVGAGLVEQAKAMVPGVQR